MKTLLATTAIALLATIGQAHAVNFGDTTNNNLTAKGGNAEATAVSGSVSAASLNAAFKNFLAQQQGQQQAVDNSDSTKISINQDFESRPSGPSIAAGLAALPSFSNAGNMNACAGAEGRTGSIGGSVGLTNGSVSGSGGLIGIGWSDVVEIEKCEKRESVALLFSLGLKEGALAVACTHTDMAIGVNKQFPGFCAASQPKPVVANSQPTVVAKAPVGTGSNHPDYAKLQ